MEKVSEEEYQHRMNAVLEAIHSQYMDGDSVGSDTVANLKAYARGEMTLQQVEDY